MSTPNRENIIRMAREAGFKASVGKTDKDGVYHPDVNAIGKDVPIEWVERLAQAAYAAGAAAERKKPHNLSPGEMELALRRDYKGELFHSCHRFTAEQTDSMLGVIVGNAAEELNYRINCEIRARGQA